MTSATPALATRYDVEVAVEILRARGAHISPVSWQGQAAWLKLAVPRSPAWRYQLLATAARALRLAALQPLRPPGGNQGLALEAARIRKLRAAGLHAPDVLVDAPGWLVLSDLGGLTLDRLLRAADPVERLSAWQLGADYLIDAHRAGQYLSQAFSRNFVWSDENGLGAIDFEDDSCEVMSLADAQVRDWLPYCFSSAIYFSGHLPELHHALSAALMRESPAVRTGVRRALSRTAWLRVARRLPDRWQRSDVLKTAAYGELAAYYRAS